jgi:hypothetical protein
MPSCKARRVGRPSVSSRERVKSHTISSPPAEWRTIVDITSRHGFKNPMNLFRFLLRCSIADDRELASIREPRAQRGKGNLFPDADRVRAPRTLLRPPA